MSLDSKNGAENAPRKSRGVPASIPEVVDVLTDGPEWRNDERELDRDLYRDIGIATSNTGDWLADGIAAYDETCSANEEREKIIPTFEPAGPAVRHVGAPDVDDLDASFRDDLKSILRVVIPSNLNRTDVDVLIYAIGFASASAKWSLFLDVSTTMKALHLSDRQVRRVIAKLRRLKYLIPIGTTLFGCNRYRVEVGKVRSLRPSTEERQCA